MILQLVILVTWSGLRVAYHPGLDLLQVGELSVDDEQANNDENPENWVVAGSQEGLESGALRGPGGSGCSKGSEGSIGSRGSEGSEDKSQELRSRGQEDFEEDWLESVIRI